MPCMTDLASRPLIPQQHHRHVMIPPSPRSSFEPIYAQHLLRVPVKLLDSATTHARTRPTLPNSTHRDPNTATPRFLLLGPPPTAMPLPRTPSSAGCSRPPALAACETVTTAALRSLRPRYFRPVFHILGYLARRDSLDLLGVGRMSPRPAGSVCRTGGRIGVSAGITLPRDTDMGELAEALDVPHQALSERLRRATHDLIGNTLLVDEDENENKD